MTCDVHPMSKRRKCLCYIESVEFTVKEMITLMKPLIDTRREIRINAAYRRSYQSHVLNTAIKFKLTDCMALSNDTRENTSLDCLIKSMRWMWRKKDLFTLFFDSLDGINETLAKDSKLIIPTFGYRDKMTHSERAYTVYVRKIKKYSHKLIGLFDEKIFRGEVMTCGGCVTTLNMFLAYFFSSKEFSAILCKIENSRRENQIEKLEMILDRLLEWRNIFYGVFGIVNVSGIFDDLEKNEYKLGGLCSILIHCEKENMACHFICPTTSDILLQNIYAFFFPISVYASVAVATDFYTSRRSAKCLAEIFHYHNLLTQDVRRNIILSEMSYRLSPSNDVPSGSEGNNGSSCDHQPLNRSRRNSF